MTITVTADTPTETFVITGVQMDIQNQSVSVTISRRINGDEIGVVPFMLSGAGFASTFSQQTRDGLATAILNAAISAGVISGTVG